MLFRLVSIALAAISFTTFQSSAEIINWATDSSKLPYVIGDIIIFEGANYVASATGSESPSVKPSNFVDIAEELEEVSKSLPPDPPTWTDEQRAQVQADAAALTAPDSNSSQSNGLVSLSLFTQKKARQVNTLEEFVMLVLALTWVKISILV